MGLETNRSKHTPSIRGGFSHRKGFIPISETIQLNSLDNRARVEIYNLFQRMVECIYNGHPNRYNTFVQDFFTDALCEPIENSYGYKWSSRRLSFPSDILKPIIIEGEYFEVFDVVEFLLRYFSEHSSDDTIMSSIALVSPTEINSILERECVGYRYVGGKIIDNVNVEEISEIDQATKLSHSGPSDHILKSIELLYNRKKPDYENSIKESISAIEAMCKIIAEAPSATLGDALKKVDSLYPIQPALKAAFSALYGYTCDASGVRHSIAEGKAGVTFEEAKFMLVTCSAFLNYLDSVYKK